MDKIRDRMNEMLSINCKEINKSFESLFDKAVRIGYIQAYSTIKTLIDFGDDKREIMAFIEKRIEELEDEYKLLYLEYCKEYRINK